MQRGQYETCNYDLQSRMSSNDKVQKPTRERHVWAYIIAVGAIPVILYLWYKGGQFAMTGGAWLFKQDGEQTSLEPGAVGDMFGAVNALFSGLAFWGVSVALIINAYEYRLARRARSEDLLEQRKIASAQIEVAESQRLVARSGEAFRPWQQLGSQQVIEGLGAIPRLHGIVLRRHREPGFNQYRSVLGGFVFSGVEPNMGYEYGRTPYRYDEGKGVFNKSLFESDVSACTKALIEVVPSIDAGIYAIHDLASKATALTCLMLASLASGVRTQATGRILRDLAAQLHDLELATCENDLACHICTLKYEVARRLYSVITDNTNADRLSEIGSLERELLDLQQD